MPHESSLQSDALAYLNSLPQCVAENVSGNSSQSGRPDINGCFRGRSFKIELKVLDRGNTPTKKQLFDLLRWQKAGAIVMVAYTLKDVKSIFTKTGLSCDGWFKHYKGNMNSFMCCRREDTLIESMLEELQND